MKRWPTKLLGELVSLEYGKALKEEERSQSGHYPVYGSNGIVGSHNLALVKDPTIIVGRKGAIGEAHLAQNGCWPIDTAFYTVFRQPVNVSLHYLLLWFRSVDLRSLAITSTIPGLNRNTLYRQQVPVPPLEEQERIVILLDEADELRKLRAQAGRRTAALVPALFDEMFGDVDCNSKKWPMVHFAEIGEARLGKMLDAKRQTGRNTRPYLRNANVQWDRLELTDILEMDFSDSDRREFRLRYGDLLICEGGVVGRSAIWRDEIPECYFQKALHRVQVHPSKANPEFVLHLLHAISTVNGFRNYIGSSTIPHLTGVKLASIRIPLPPIVLQKEFAQRVTEIRELESAQAASSRRLEALFQSLLHRAFQGEL
jgi:type I restriction enzyme, S subunit